MAAALGRKEPSRRSRVHEWETGSRTPGIGIIVSYSKIFSISTDDLLDDERRLDLIGDQEISD